MESSQSSHIILLTPMIFYCLVWALRRVVYRKDHAYVTNKTLFTWPVFGDAFLLMRLFKCNGQALIELAEKHGGTTKLWVGPQPVLIINRARDAKKLLDTRGSIYSDRPLRDGFRQRVWPSRVLGVGVGPELRMLRRINHKLLAAEQVVHFRGYQEFESILMLMGLLKTPGDFCIHSERFAISVIFSAVFGVRLAQLDHPIMVAFYKVWADMLRYFQPGTLLVDYFPILNKLPRRFQSWLRVASELKERESMLYQAFLTTLRTQLKTGTAPKCFASEFLKLQGHEDIDKTDDDQAIGIFGMLVGAGADATNSILQTFFKIMAMNPRALHACQKEIDQVVGPSRLPTWDDQRNLPYLRALIKEVHRWAPIGTLGVPHATSEEDPEFGLPQGTIVFPNLPALSRDPEVYENPDEFCPERFLGHDLDAFASANHPDFRKRDHFHYGFGRRICQGIFFSEASLYILIARIIWAFDISTLPGEPPLDLNDKILGLITKPKPYHVRISVRSDTVKGAIEDAVSELKTSIADFDSIQLKKY